MRGIKSTAPQKNYKKTTISVFMIIQEINTADRHQVNEFIKISFKVYRNCQQWVPPLEIEIRKLLNRSKHPFYKDGEALFLMVYSEKGEALGRIAVLDNKRFNRHNKSTNAFFYLFEVTDNFKAAEVLFKAAEKWSCERGLDTLIGPKGFTPLNGLGMLTKGFENRLALGIPYNHAYYPVFMDRMGFKPSRDVVSGYMD